MPDKCKYFNWWQKKEKRSIRLSCREVFLAVLLGYCNQQTVSYIYDTHICAKHHSQSLFSANVRENNNNVHNILKSQVKAFRKIIIGLGTLWIHDKSALKHGSTPHISVTDMRFALQTDYIQMQLTLTIVLIGCGYNTHVAVADSIWDLFCSHHTSSGLYLDKM